MRFQTPLVRATLRQRYKRFLADAVLDDGRKVTAHCPNPGAMTGLAVPGLSIWLEPNDDPKKKLKFGWRLVEFDDGTFVGIDTGAANRMMGQALAVGTLTGCPPYNNFRAEVPYGDNSRVDFLLEGADGAPVWLEVKSVTLSRQPGLAEFPDTKTARGAKHLQELAAIARDGGRAMVAFVVQRTDAQRVGIAADIDPIFARAAADAVGAGVTFVAYGTNLSPQGMSLSGPLPVDVPER